MPPPFTLTGVIMSNVTSLDIRGDYIYRDVPFAVVYNEENKMWNWSCNTSQIYTYVNVPLLGSQRSRALAIDEAKAYIDTHFKHKEKHNNPGHFKTRNVSNRGRYDNADDDGA